MHWRLHLFLLWVGVCDGLSSPASTSTTASGKSLLRMNSASRHTLYDLPVSNNGARCRLILYKKGITTSEVDIVSPAELGGLKSEEYQQVNPQGKMPALVIHNNGVDPSSSFGIAESDTISRYLMSTYATTGPSFQPDLARSNLMARFHDIYLTTIQGCLYKPTPPFGVYQTRQDALLEFQSQLQVLEDLVVDDGQYLCGSDISYADAAIFPTLVFAAFMMPKFDGAAEGFQTTLPPKLNQYLEHVRTYDSAFGKVYNEIMDVLEGSWEQERKRWDGIWLAGQRDTDPDTIFDKIVAKEISAGIVRETDDILAFTDINPAAPAHILVIPKNRNGLSRLQKATPEHVEILGKLMVVAGEIARDESLGFGPDGARIVVNDGPAAGQEVPHLHIHVIGGRAMAWPPG
ncbi:14 kDa zinc-binding protein [Seminavis robusta]|uniref:14 kDa zinc-binding protein n=1 Tax=Seminavis robusta TaxID=568900 RepID=A0A9N8F1P4_9STRA|nr:14 kDa zinc-binding protein [Seminavis robusta]|eukprot:Sro2634_g333280.1 14 kDa zinc-binding protein (404) ;mRNA; r:7652-9153